MRVWHSFDNAWLDREESTARMEQMGGGALPELHEVRTQTTERGFIVQGWIEGGAGARTHILQVLTVDDGKIASCEEYVAPEMNLGDPLTG
jgi:hypothetical protein